MATNELPSQRDGRAFLTNHARVLLAVAGDCNVRMRDMAESVGITERAAYGILCDLIEQGYVSRDRVGRRNCYSLHTSRASGRKTALSELESLVRLLRSGDAD